LRVVRPGDKRCPESKSRRNRMRPIIRQKPSHFPDGQQPLTSDLLHFAMRNSGSIPFAGYFWCGIFVGKQQDRTEDI
jgi:hypothetical protein